MPDISKTFAELIALFADNVTGDISPQDQRNFAASIFQYGGIALPHSVGPGTPQTIGTSFVKVDQFSSNSDSSSGITPDHTTDKLTVVKGGVFVFGVTISVGGDPNVTWEGTVFNNNVDADMAGVDLSIGGGSVIVNAAAMAIITLADADELDYRVSANSSSKSFQLHAGSIMLFRIG